MTAASETELNPAMLRVVVFGRPQAGKSTLLGALALSAVAHERVLGARLTDLSHGLEELRRRLEEDRPRETQTETVFYPIALEPFMSGAPDPTRRTEVVLIDCDGRVAHDLMTRREPMNDAAGTLSGEILAADAILLLVDAGADAVQIDADLGEAARFLRWFERDRGRRTEVGGLPVTLVLSKCDLLAQSTDSYASWIGRIESRKRDVGQRFRDFLDQDGDDRLAFGEIDLRLAATAVHLPALVGAPARSREPWGVAELFRDAIGPAVDYRRRRQHSQKRLFWTLLAAAGLLAACVLFAATLFVTRQNLPAVALTAKVESFRAREGQTASVRLSEPLQRKFSELSDLFSDPQFPKLTPELQKYLLERIEEMTAYRDYRDRLMQVRAPADVRSEDELQTIERRLRDDLPPPASFAAEWKQTEAALIRDKWLDDIKALQLATNQVAEWYRQLTARGNRIVLFGDLGSTALPLSWSRWQDDGAAALREADSPPFRAGDKLKDSRSVGGFRAATYASVLVYPSVAAARNDWQKLRPRLERTRDFAAALGLGTEGAVLKLSDRFATEQARDVLSRLKSDHPHWSQWSLADIAEPGATPMRQAVQAGYNHAIEPAKREIARQANAGIADGKVPPQRWRTVAEAVAAAPELREHRELVSALAKWLDPSAENPFAAFVAFTARDRFEIDLRRVRLTIPDDLRNQRFRPQGNLAISIQNGDDTPQKISLRPTDEGVRDPRLRATTYAFAVEGSGAAAVRPGEEISGELAVRDTAGKPWQFTWYANGIRAPAYQFDRFDLPPRIHRADQPIDDGELATGVTMIVWPERGWPRLPDLLPAVR